MTAPRIEACFFANETGAWGRLAGVLEWTAHRQCPGWRVTVSHIWQAALPTSARRLSDTVNTQKLMHWHQRVQESADGDRLLLIDADTMILRPLDDIWDQPFDLAYTARPTGVLFPINGGVVFLRISDRVKAFMAGWLAENVRLLSDPASPWLRSHGGINQASLGSMLAHRADGLLVRELRCLEWNCEDTTWAAFDPEVTRIVHVKSALRVACMESQPIPAHLASLSALWKGFDRSAREAMAS